MRVKVSGFLTSWDFSEKSSHSHGASVYPGEFIWYCEKVISTGFGVPTFDAVGTPIGTKYIISGGLFMGAYKEKTGVGMCPSATKTGWENHPAKQKEGSPRNEMHWHGNGSFCKSIPVVWI